MAPSGPAVSLSLAEGVRPDFAYLFCNDRAQLPLRIHVRAAGAVIKDVGLVDASHKSVSATDHAASVASLQRRAVAQYAERADERGAASHPVNRALLPTARDEADETFAFLLRTRRGADGAASSPGDVLCVAAYAVLAGYTPERGAPSKSVVCRSHTGRKRRRDASADALSVVRVELCAKPPLRLMPLRQDLTAFGPEGAAFSSGAIYQIVADYGIHAGAFRKVNVKIDGTVFYKRGCDDGKAVFEPVSAESLPSSQFSSASEHDGAATTFYCDSPKAMPDMLVRAVFHGENGHGAVTHPLKDGEAVRYNYRKMGFDEGKTVASFSWYCFRHPDLQTESMKSPAWKVNHGRFKLQCSDEYGSETSLTVDCETALTGVLPARLLFESRVEHP